MKKIVSLIIVIILACGIANAQTIIVQNANGGNARHFTDLKTAIDAANSGDYVYLSGGNYDISEYLWMGYDGRTRYTGYLIVDKPIHIVGAGYNQGADLPYITNGHLAFRHSASGSSITGIKVDQVILDSISNMRISRCHISSHLSFCATGQGNLISENIIRYISSRISIPNSNNGLNSYYNTTMITKNIIKYYSFNSISGVNNVDIHNNIIEGGIHTQNSTIKNNIHTYNSLSLTSCTFSNNLLTYYITQTEGNSYANNLQGFLMNEIFVNFGAGDYHLLPNCPGVGAGTDGNDIGIYGTSQPFKDSRLPEVPHFLIKNIAPETDANGKLKIDITIEAQER